MSTDGNEITGSGCDEDNEDCTSGSGANSLDGTEEPPTSKSHFTQQAYAPNNANSSAVDKTRESSFQCKPGERAFLCVLHDDPQIL